MVDEEIKENEVSHENKLGIYRNYPKKTDLPEFEEKSLKKKIAEYTHSYPTSSIASQWENRDES